MMRTIILPHIVAAILATGILLLVYASVQQQYRTGANDPQIQQARDVAISIKRNKPVSEIIPADTIDLEQSLSTCMQVYDEKQNLVLSNGVAGSKPPILPPGVLNEAKTNGEYIVTWQPSATVRQAAVVVYTGVTGAAYVVASRSLIEVEKRESALLQMVFMCWLVCISVICAHALLQSYLLKRAMP